MRLLLLCLFLTACGGGDEPEPKRLPICLKTDPKAIDVICEGEARSCRAVNRCTFDREE